jgi:hypothetical protein
MPSIKHKGKGSINFRFLSGDVHWKEYGGKFISKRFANAPGTKPGDEDFEFHWWFILEVNGGCRGYEVTLSVVAPKRCSEEKRDAALESWGLEPANWGTMSLRQQCDVLHSYGIRAHIAEWQGNNLGKLMKLAREKARETEFMFGFAMDRRQNDVGASGWDFLEGNILGPLGQSPQQSQPPQQPQHQQQS